MLQICNDDIHELDSVDNSLDVVEVVPMKVLFGKWVYFIYVLYGLVRVYMNYMIVLGITCNFPICQCILTN